MHGGLLLSHQWCLAIHALIDNRSGASLRSVNMLLRYGLGQLLLARSPVGLNVKHDEQDEIGAQDGASSSSGIFFTLTVTDMRDRRPVLAHKSVPSSEVHNNCTVLKLNLECERNCLNLPRSITNWVIWKRVIHSFHHTFTPRALWK